MRHSEEQIIAILKEHEAGVKTADLCRKHAISEQRFYNWKAKYGGLQVSEAKRLKGMCARLSLAKEIQRHLYAMLLDDPVPNGAQCLFEQRFTNLNTDFDSKGQRAGISQQTKPYCHAGYLNI